MPRTFARTLAALAFASLGGVACTSAVVPVPVAGDAERASVRWADADLDQLNAGRTLYVRKCGACHTLFSPRSRSPEVWPREVDEMAVKINLPDRDRDLITRYLVTMSELTTPSAASPRAAKADAPAAGVEPLAEPEVDPQVR